MLSSFSEKRYAFVWVKWQISVQPCIIIIIILIESKNYKDPYSHLENAFLL